MEWREEIQNGTFILSFTDRNLFFFVASNVMKSQTLDLMLINPMQVLAVYKICCDDLCLSFLVDLVVYSPGQRFNYKFK